MSTNHERPTSDWKHSHALEAGDELIDTGENTAITVNDVREDGSISCRVWLDERHGQDYICEVWTEEETRRALADGIFERTDGLSHELATF